MSNDITKFTSDLTDMKSWMNTYADTRLCKGGRLVHGMYCCLHCGSADPSNECAAPKPKTKEVYNDGSCR